MSTLLLIHLLQGTPPLLPQLADRTTIKAAIVSGQLLLSSPEVDALFDGCLFDDDSAFDEEIEHFRQKLAMKV
jgi:hypothetical protein